MESARLYASFRKLTSVHDRRIHIVSAMRPGSSEATLAQIAASLGGASIETVRPERLVNGRIGTLVRETPGRRTFRVEPVPGGEGAVVVKQYAPGAGRRGKIARWAAPAQIECQRLLELGRAGIPVPRLLFGCWSRLGGFGPGVTIQAALPGEGLDEVFPRAHPVARTRCALADLLPLVRELHGAGYVHRDLYLGHVLGQLDDSGRIRIHGLVDVARATTRHGWGHRLRVKDLAALFVSLAPWVETRILLRGFASYCAGSVLPARWCGRSGRRRLLAAILARAERMRRHRPRFDPPVLTAVASTSFVDSTPARPSDRTPRD
ncbi:MAG: hypothetical protein KDC95_00510 [Planctomycetes bacterium]|nr:hypothetical protein [Planctomycetota bacterium]